MEIFLDPEIAEMVRFLDPEIVKVVDRSYIRQPHQEKWSCYSPEDWVTFVTLKISAKKRR